MNSMLKKDSEINWDDAARESFMTIKKVLAETPVIISLDYTKEFMIFLFASEHTIAAILLHQNDEGYEQPIAFFSKAPRNAELKYHIIEKQAYALVKALKSFREYMLQAQIVSYVPCISLKYMLC
jgi:hypothetical protein